MSLRQTLMVVIAVHALIGQAAAYLDAKTVLNGLAKAIGATVLKAIPYAGSGPSSV